MDPESNGEDRPRKSHILRGALVGAVMFGGISMLAAVVYLGLMNDCWG